MRFLKVTPAMAIKMHNELNSIEIALCIYLHAYTPYRDDIIDISLPDLANHFKVSRSWISKSYKNLVDKKWIDPSQYKLAFSPIRNKYEPVNDIKVHKRYFENQKAKEQGKF